MPTTPFQVLFRDLLCYTAFRSLVSGSLWRGSELRDLGFSGFLGFWLEFRYEKLEGVGVLLIALARCGWVGGGGGLWLCGGVKLGPVCTREEGKSLGCVFELVEVLVF